MPVGFHKAFAGCLVVRAKHSVAAVERELFAVAKLLLEQFPGRPTAVFLRHPVQSRHFPSLSFGVTQSL